MGARRHVVGPPDNAGGLKQPGIQLTSHDQDGAAVLPRRHEGHEGLRGRPGVLRGLRAFVVKWPNDVDQVPDRAEPPTEPGARTPHMTASATSHPHVEPRRPRIGPSQAIALAMLVGVGLGVCFPDGAPSRGFRATDLQVFSSLFLRMISMTIVPLLFATLVVGVAGHGDDLKRMGRLAVRSLLYFEVVTTLALVVGLMAVNLVRPGIGVSLAAGAAAGVSVAAPPPAPGF